MENNKTTINKICEVCNTMHDHRAEFCEKCGAQLKEIEIPENDEQDSLGENKTIVTGKICDACNVLYDPDTKFCPRCGSSKLTDLVTTTWLQQIHAKEADKKHKRNMYITVLVCFLIMFALFAYMLIRMHIEGAF